MDFNSIINIALPVVGVILGIALVVFVIELIKTLRTTRTTITEVTEQLKPTIEHVGNITAKLEPAMDRIDPLLEHVNLTVDAANLEIMRVDKILENFGEISDGINDAASAVSQIANAPVSIVSGLAGKAYHVLKRPDASQESIRLAAEKAARMKNLTAELESEDPKPEAPKAPEAAEGVSAGFEAAASQTDILETGVSEDALEETPAPQYFVMEDPCGEKEETE